ncbi:hypothetical protein [Nostoc sp. PA-18-2419]|uniref:hypothetical protein n=1 Tax=Nostoc sp. PA-18-2419 TaxID=2575443 RepID=UPI0011087B68|nr:hypothetical protein [Nostoc sp. PA-18-2419]
MKPLVADKTSIPAIVRRRHTDPPGLWISVVIGSVSIHLLVFWLMRSSNTFSLWFPQETQSAVPIELIDISSKTKSTAKTVSPKRLSSTQKSVPARTTPKNQDFSAINSSGNLQAKSKTDASQSNSQRFRQRTVSKPIPKPTPTAIPKIPTDASQTNSQRSRQQSVPKSIATPIPKATPTIPVANLPWNRRQKLKFGKGTPLPAGIPSNPPVKETSPTPPGQTPPTPTGQTPLTPTKETPPTPTQQTPLTSTGQTSPTPARETPSIPTGQTPSTPTRETLPTSTQGASVAIVAPLLKNEVSSLIKAGRLRQDGLPDAIAVYKGSSTKQFDSSFLPQNYELKPASLLASLLIDRNGNFQQAVVLEIQPATLQSQKSTYQQVLNEIFKTENFVAAQNNDGTKPDLSNLYVIIKIQSPNSN